jgi:undecaprenyl-diphosphatase
MESQITYYVQNIFLSLPLGELVIIFCARYLIFIFIPIHLWFYSNSNTQIKHAIKESVWSVLLAVLFGTVISFVVGRERPFIIDEFNIISIIPPPLTSSFPSLHSAISIALIAPLIFKKHAFAYWLPIIALIVMLGRLAAGVHFISDILGGILVGIISFSLIRLGHAFLRRH